ncbi:RNA polymerase, sigma-24 subunit, ECF subfamily [Allomuricauda ruestringensis DSM 13258]|uniref:RNA polymerase sigma factor n=1 Tax=Allomuricauda ruestringensis (strain DSM 13258 / CIP 107369 / LMG 19739 / B1) TaxID=886377 RepID=G2PPW4_ALLRU|nr:RNA polymerase sigma factor [Allomuricauda ruestringensis]AEM71542.1 RNA polymerase, sigma-24 subunit, ECF subfamily [Allomuricauda ruestringensis DSM 13258]
MAIRDNDIDAILIERVKEGDEKAFVQLVDKYKDLSLSLAHSIMKDRDKAEDVLQDAFIKVYEKAGSFKHQSAFSSWLYRIVVNTAYNALKKERKYREMDDFTLEGKGIENPPDSDKIRDGDRKKYIVMALERLRPDEALVLRLHYLCGYTIPEIHEITGFGNSKIKVDLHRGRGHMEEVLTDLLGDHVKDLL